MAVLILVGAIVRVVTEGSSLPRPPHPAPVGAATAGAPAIFAYDPAREAQYVDRAVAGNAHPLFVKSPGGALGTAARVARYRPLIDKATAGTGIDPNLLEGLVFVESAGRPQVIAGTDAADAAGLTQILAATGQTLLGMRIDLSRSRQLTAQIESAQSRGQRRRLGSLLARRADADARFDPSRALAATVRYLQLAERRFHRQDLAFESYHMGMGNLQQVLGDYDGGRAVPYAQVYFDSAPNRHVAAERQLAGLGDESELYWWRVLGAVQVMHLYRTDRPALARLVTLQRADNAGAAVLHPPDAVPGYRDPKELAAAYQRRAIVPLPSNEASLGVAVAPGMGARSKRVGAPPSLYRGLRPVALRLLIELAGTVRSLSGGHAPLQLVGTVADRRYQRRALGGVYAPAATGYSFEIARRYVSSAQAEAFQEVLDRLQSLNLIAWAREPSVIQVTVASDALSWLTSR